MDFPSTDCERDVLKRLKIQGSLIIPPEMAAYICAACNVGLPSFRIATDCARLLAWPSILKKLCDEFPELDASTESQLKLRKLYLSTGLGPKFLKRLSEFLEATGKRDKEASLLEARIKEHIERRKAWDATMAASAEASNMRFEQELLLDFEVFDLSLGEVQRELMRMADAEDKANAMASSHVKITLV